MTDQTGIDALRGAPVTPGQLFIGGQWVEAADGFVGSGRVSGDQAAVGILDVD